jgi:hypothetical protein
MDRSLVLLTIYKWKKILGIEDWSVGIEKIDPEKVTVEYCGHKYFIGIFRDFDKKEATIYYDTELDEETIAHELLHIVFPKPEADETYHDYELWITDASENLYKQHLEEIWTSHTSTPTS